MCEERQTRRYLLGASERYLEAQGHHPNQEDRDAPEDPGGQKQRDHLPNLSTNTCGKRKRGDCSLKYPWPNVETQVDLLGREDCNNHQKTRKTLNRWTAWTKRASMVLCSKLRSRYRHVKSKYIQSDTSDESAAPKTHKQ